MPDTNIEPAISTDDAAAIAADILGETTSTEGNVEGGGEAEATASPAEDAQVAAQDEPVATDEAAGEGAGKEPSEKVQDALDAFIAKKYQGDRGKFVEGLWNLMSTGSKQHAEIQELKAKLDQALTKPEPEVDPLDTEDGQGLKQQLAVVERGVQSANRQQNAILSRVEKTREEIAELRGELKRAEDFEKVTIRQQINDKERDLKEEERLFNDLESKKEDYGIRRDDIQAKVKALQAAHKEQRESRQSAVAQAMATRNTFVRDINAAVDAAVVSKGFEVSDKVRGSFWKHLQGQAALHWQANPDTPIEPSEFVKTHAEEFFEGRKAAFVQKNKERIAAAPSLGTPKGAAPKPGQPAANNTLPKGKMSLAQSLEWRRKFLG